GGGDSATSGSVAAPSPGSFRNARRPVQCRTDATGHPAPSSSAGAPSPTPPHRAALSSAPSFDLAVDPGPLSGHGGSRAVARARLRGAPALQRQGVAGRPPRL